MDIKNIKPRQFKEVVGQAFTKQIIQSSLNRKSYPQISLYGGPSGTGKSTLAEIVAMSLTCKEGKTEPCLKCENCLDNLHAFSKGENTSRIVKVNVGLALGKKDVLEIIKDIFILQPKQGVNSVYILEEIHALSKQDQIPFLEEMSNIPEGVFVIMCTTQTNKLIPELRGRATTLTLKPPTFEECSLLVDLTCNKLKISTPKENVVKMLVQRVGHVPREIVKIILLLSSGLEVNEYSVKEYLGIVDFKEYLTMLEKTSENMFEYVKYLEGVKVKGISYIDFMKGLKDFFIDTVTYIYGHNNINVDNNAKGRLKKIFQGYSEREFLDVLEFVGSLTADTEEDSYYQFIMLKRFLNNTTEKEVIKDSKKNAMVTTIQSERKTDTIASVKEEETGRHDFRNEEVSLDYIQELTGDLTISKK